MNHRAFWMVVSSLCGLATYRDVLEFDGTILRSWDRRGHCDVFALHGETLRLLRRLANPGWRGEHMSEGVHA